jgi:single-strand DNA-binding protein
MKKLIITGNVGRDPEVRADSDGNHFVTFSVAVSVGTKANPKTDWIEVSCSGRLVNPASRFVRRGGKVLLEGYPTINVYLTKDKEPAGVMKLYAHHLELLSYSQDAESNIPESGEIAKYQEDNILEEEISFL